MTASEQRLELAVASRGFDSLNSGFQPSAGKAPEVISDRCPLGVVTCGGGVVVIAVDQDDYAPIARAACRAVGPARMVEA